jgi:Cft2 family RNA processing exonuclease
MYASHRAQGEGPCCYLLEVDQFKLLLDCGWTEQFDVEALRRLESYAPHIDAVLLSHPDLSHLGALPYAFAKLGLDCAVYATTPVSLMGQMFLFDAWKARQREEEFDLFTPDDIETAFSRACPPPTLSPLYSHTHTHARTHHTHARAHTHTRTHAHTHYTHTHTHARARAQVLLTSSTSRVCSC